MKRFHTLLMFSACFAASLFPAASCKAAREADTVSPGLYEIVPFTNTDLVLEMKTCTVSPLEEHTLQLYYALDTNQQKFYVETLSDDTCRISTLSTGEALTAQWTDEMIVPDLVIDLETGTLNSKDIPNEQALDENVLYAGAVLLKPLDRTANSAYITQSADDSQNAGRSTSDSTVSPQVHSNNSPDADKSISLNPQSWTFEETKAGFFFIRSADGKYLTVDSPTAYTGTTVSLQSFTGDRNQKWRLSKTWGSTAEAADTDCINPYTPDGAYRNVRLSLAFGENTETLTAAEFYEWMTDTEDHQLQPDREAITSYVNGLAEKYDTQGKPRRFMTSHGKEITLYKGNFGWKLDVEKTVDLILKYGQTNESVTTEPVWAHRGSSFDTDNDIGDSYVEVDLVNQKVWLYQDGELLLETDCVTGTYGTENQTPGGVYSIYYRQSPDVLEGPGYSSAVEYWMAFNGGIGLHDANWRSTFGGDIYKTNGSHGCINLPTEAARLIYEVAQIGYPVVCYN